jgi:NTE family protein
MTEPASSRPKIAIACQGGGSQTAFTAGVLKALVDLGVGRDIEVVSISGTSGGAVCATLLWFGFWKNDQPLWRRLIDFWQDNIPQNWAESAFNDMVIQSLRMVNSGMLPSFQLSPSSPAAQTMLSMLTFGARNTVTDFPTLLSKYIDFDEIRRWGPRAERPVLVIGAANVTTGKLAKFVSRNEPIRREHVLASCCVPSIFPAVRIDDELYWDGLFSDNPPVEELIRDRSVGANNVPEEIWVIKINPTHSASPLENPAHIIDRRNQVEGNISLFQQLGHLEMRDDMIMLDAFRPEWLAQYDVKAPIRIPKSFATDADRPYHIPWIEMPDSVQASLDYEGKIDRSARNINTLIAMGEGAARAFMEKRKAALAAHPVLTRPA